MVWLSMSVCVCLTVQWSTGIHVALSKIVGTILFMPNFFFTLEKLYVFAYEGNHRTFTHCLIRTAYALACAGVIDYNNEVFLPIPHVLHFVWHFIVFIILFQVRVFAWAGAIWEPLHFFNQPFSSAPMYFLRVNQGVNHYYLNGNISEISGGIRK